MAQTRPRRRRKRKPADPLDLNPAARWRFGIGQSKADNLREIRAAQEAGLGDVYAELARRVERAERSLLPIGDKGSSLSKAPPPGDKAVTAPCLKKLDTPAPRETMSR